MKVLIVDDSSVMRKIVLRTLRQAGYGGHEFEESPNGADALAKIEADPPDAILSDWNMPEMSGLELLQALKAKDIDIPFAFITSESTEAMHQLGNEAGALAFLTKPFTPDSLESALDKILG